MVQEDGAQKSQEKLEIEAEFLPNRPWLLKAIVLQVRQAMYPKEHVAHAGNGSIKRYVALCLWLLVAGMFFSVARQWIAFSSSDKQFTEYVQGVLQRALLDRRPAKDVRMLVLTKAAQLSIPVQQERISITGDGTTLRTVIAYDTEIKIPLVDRVLYRMEFSNNLSNKAPR